MSNKLAYIALAELFERFRLPMQLHRKDAKGITLEPNW